MRDAGGGCRRAKSVSTVLAPTKRKVRSVTYTQTIYRTTRTFARRLIGPLAWARALEPTAVVHAIHGLVLFVAITGATFVSDYPGWQILLYSAGSVVLFWVTHVYAASLAHHDTPDAAPVHALEIVAGEARRGLPILQACTLAAMPLLLAITGLIPLTVAYSVSVSLAVAELGVFGFLVIRGRGGSPRRSLAAGLLTGSIGAAIIAAETFWH